MVTKRNNRQIQSILYLTLLCSTLIFTTGCFGEPQGHIINTRQRMSNHNNPFPNPSSRQPSIHTQGSSSIQIAEYTDNNGAIEDVVGDFVGETLIGYVQDITITFHDDNTVSITIWDEDHTAPFNATLYLNQSVNGDVISYSDDYGTVYFERIEEGVSQVSFENADGVAYGILGYIEM